ncbi:M48 family metallopeptidase [Candidatus Tisiphia endosymbiont of Nemotelus uliginosus]|uniref:M48 family metallopeptidase n=1 Tax=Candidatus Tisiphia endosymbiont of Nemotelus uliginosus TaxID=3077926 RepID=UPI0035C8E0CD
MQHNQKLIDNLITLERQGPPIQVPIRYSNKAKNIAIRISNKGPELVLPDRNLNAGYNFLLKKEEWVRKKLQKFSKIEIDPYTIPILGETYSLQMIKSLCNKVEINQNIIQVYSILARYNNILINFLQKKLLVEVNSAATILSQQYNLKFSKIKLINNSSKWGSCNSRGVLSFNWRLVFAPKEVLEYVIVHEMCHIIEMNHSPRFWALVGRIYPNYKAAKVWLKQYGFMLYHFLKLN